MKSNRIFISVFFTGLTILSAVQNALAEPDDIGVKATAIEETLVLNPFFQEAYFKNEEETVTIINILKEVSGGVNHNRPATADIGVRGIEPNAETGGEPLDQILSANPLLKSAFEKDEKKTREIIARLGSGG